ncbi:MAG: phytase [Bryobacterales bacterium]|nr:phytase [Bryobacterales bacterium]
MRALLFAALLFAPAADVAPLGETASEPHQTDDPAIWINPRNPSEVLVFGTVKMAAPDGAIAVYRRDGSRLMRIEGVDRPNNIDVAYGLQAGPRRIDIAVATERNKSRLRVFEIVSGKGLKDLAALPVFEGQTGAAAQPMGIALYQRAKDRAIFAIVSRKSGPSGSYLWQYRLDGAGPVLRAVKVREFGAFSGTKEIEAVAADSTHSVVYYSDEGAGIRKYHADPDHRDAARELALFAQTGWKGDREGIAVYKDYIIATDQQHPVSEFHVFAGATLRHLGVFRLGSDTTDGIDIAPNGLFAAMNDSRRNFILADWKSIAAALRLR